MQRLAYLRVADGVGNGCLGKTGDTDQVACLHLVDGHALRSFKAQQLGQPSCLDLLTIEIDRLDGRIHLRRALDHATGQAAAEERVAVEERGQHGERLVGLDIGRRHMGQHPVQQRMQVLARAVQLFIGPAVTAGRIQNGEIQLLVIRIQRDKQVEHFIDHRIGTAIRTVDLVDHDNRAQALLQRFAKHELGLRHRPLGGVGQQDHAVGHAKNALHLTAEISMAGRVDDVDARIFPDNRSRFGKNGDSALFLEITRIHQPFGDLLVVTEQARLFHDGIDKRCLAMIDMRDDGNIAKL